MALTMRIPVAASSSSARGGGDGGGGGGDGSAHESTGCAAQFAMHLN